MLSDVKDVSSSSLRPIEECTISAHDTWRLGASCLRDLIRVNTVVGGDSGRGGDGGPEELIDHTPILSFPTWEAIAFVWVVNNIKFEL